MDIGIEHIMILVVSGLAVMLLVLLPDAGMLLKRNAHYVFFAACLAVCAYSVSTSDILGGSAVSLSRAALDLDGFIRDKSSLDRNLSAEMAECETFLRARQSGEPYPAQPQEERKLSVPINFEKKTMWEKCASRYGENYWKADTTFDGRRGGDVLCELYRDSGYVSKEVDGWCSTVFAPRPSSN